jgi:S1-C subfamily serine protease
MGVVTAKGEGQTLTFALPVSQEFVDTTLASIQKYSKIVRPLLGIQYVDITPSVQQDKKLSVSAGIYIQDVLAGMPAATAGLQAGDIVVAIQGKSISTQVPFLYHMYTYLPETTVTFTILRGNRSLDIPVLLGQNGA